MLRSIRVRLTLWYILILALVLAAVAVITYSLFVRVLEDEMRINISEMADDLVTAVNQAPIEKRGIASAEPTVEKALREFNFRDYRFVVINDKGKVIGQTLDEEMPAAIADQGEEKGFARVTIGDEILSVGWRPFHLDGHTFRLYVFFPLEDQLATERRIRNIFLIGAPVLLLLAGVGGYFLARQSLRPIAVMGERAKHIGAENLHERLPVANPDDEVGNLAVLFNQLLDRLDREFERQRRFMADASHELRTPLAIVRGESEVALQNDHRGIEEYKESLRIVNDEGKRLTKIVDDLFTLARADGGESKVSLADIPMDEIAEDCVTSIRTLAKRKRIKLNFESVPATIRGDEALLRRLFLNLLDNAVKYNLDRGSISVRTDENSFEARNTGPAIPEDQHELIFERFFRVDKAHARRAETLTSGAGLGLSIAKWIAEVHGAQLTYTRSEADENIFLVIFPR